MAPRLTAPDNPKPPSAWSETTRRAATAGGPRHGLDSRPLEPALCAVCAAIEGDRYNSAGVSHCRGCHALWSGRMAAHTSCCHRTFTSNDAADRHLVRGACTDPATLPGLESIERGGLRYWTTRER